MKTNIKVIGIMVLLITILFCSNTSALNVTDVTETLWFTIPTTDYPYAVTNSTVAFGLESATNDDVCFKVTSDDGTKTFGYQYVAVGTTYNLYGYGGFTFVYGKYKNCSSHISNSIHGYFYS